MTLDNRLYSLLGLSFSLLLVLGTLFSSPIPEASPTRADTTDTKRLRLLMVELGQDMSRINTGIWHEDYELIQEGAISIANHPKIPPDQIAKIKKALGREFQNFVRFDKSVHSTALKLVSAAEARDWSGVLTKQSELRDGCVGCHTAYRERLRPVLAPTE